MRSPALRLAFAAAVAASWAVAPIARAAEPDLARAFEAAADGERAVYAVARDLLLSTGDAALPVARRHAEDADASRRSLARLLILRHEDATGFADRSSALRNAWAVADPASAGAGRVVVRVPSQSDAGVRPGDREVRFDASHAPLVVDALRDGTAAAVATAVAGALRLAEAAPWLVECLPDGERRAAAADALVAIGAPALPAVREALATQRRGASPCGTAAAATVLGRMGDRPSAPALRDRLARSDDREVIEACAIALVTLAPQEGATTALGRLLAYDDAARRAAHTVLDYGDVRVAALAFGASLRAACEARRLVERDPIRLARLAGLVWELHDEAAARAFYRVLGEAAPGGARWAAFPGEDTDRMVEAAGRRWFWAPDRDEGLPTEAADALVAERASVLGRSRDLLAVAAGPGATRAALLRAVLLHRLRHDDAADVVEALAAIDVDGACEVVEASAADPPSRDLPARVAALFGRLDVPRVQATLERIAGGPGAAGDPSSVQGSAHRLAREGLAVARGERTLRDLLGHGAEDVRLAVARALAHRGDAAGAPLLAAAALAAEPHDYAALRDDLVRAGKAPTGTADDVRARVLHDAVAARAADPDAARAVDAARARHRPHVFHILGPQPGHFEAAGERLAAELGSSARPLLEEAALFLRDRAATHALGVRGEEASIAVLLVVARRDHASAAAALRRMGEKGLAAARELPPPDPAKPEFGSRATRHLAAAETLAGTPEGIDKALAGLVEPVPQDRDARYGWAARMRAHLDLLAPTGDPRVVEPALRILETAASSDGRLVDAALLAMEKVPDPRVVEACVGFLPAHDFDQDRRSSRQALRVLGSQLGERMADVLEERLRAGPSGRVRGGLAHALQASARTRGHRDVAASALRAQLAEADADLAAGAAWDLVRLHHRRPAEEQNPADPEALLAFVRTHPHPGLVADELARHATPGAGDALLACYLLDGDIRAVFGLSALRHAPAVPALRAAVERMLADEARWSAPGIPPEVRALAAIGGDGVAYLREVLAHRDEAVRAEVATALGEVADPAAYDPLLAVLDAIDRGAGAATVDASSRRRYAGWLLAGIDPERAQRDLSQRAVAAPDAAVARSYAEVALHVRQR